MSTVTDTFDVASDTALTAHTPDVGTSWTQRHNTMTGGKVLSCLASDDALAVTADENSVGASCSAEPAPTTADQDISITISAYETSSGTKPIYCLGRWTDNSNYYMFNKLAIGHASNDTRLYKVVAGVATLLAQVDNGGAANDVYKLELRAAAKKVYKNAVEVLSSADNVLTGVGKWGVGMGTDPGNVVGNHVDNSWRITAFSATEAAVPIVVAVGQASFTTTSQAVTAKKTRAVGQATLTNAAQAIAKVKAKAVGQPSSVDTAQAISKLKNLAVAQANSTDLAQAIAKAKSLALGQSSETDAAQSLTSTKAAAVGQVAEIEIAQPLSVAQIRLVGRASETDSVFTVESAKQLLIGRASEIDEAWDIEYPETVLLGQAEETNHSLAISSSKTKVVGQVEEVEIAQAVGQSKTGVVGQATSTESASAIAAGNVFPVGRAESTEVANSLIVEKAAAVGLALENDLANEIDIATIVPPAAETDSALPVTAHKTRAVGQVEEVDSAAQVAHVLSAQVIQASEGDSALQVSARKRLAIGSASEVLTALPVGVKLVRLVLPATETDSAAGIVRHRYFTLGQAASVETARAALYFFRFPEDNKNYLMSTKPGSGTVLSAAVGTGSFEIDDDHPSGVLLEAEI